MRFRLFCDLRSEFRLFQESRDAGEHQLTAEGREHQSRDFGKHRDTVRAEHAFHAVRDKEHQSDSKTRRHNAGKRLRLLDIGGRFRGGNDESADRAGADCDRNGERHNREAHE